jgi:hypothetical protein
VSRSRTNVRQAVARQLGLPFITGTADTFNTTSVVDALPLGRFVDNELIGFYLYPTDGTPTERNLRITDHVQSSGTATFIPTITVNSASNYELLPFPADAIHSAIDEALHMLFMSNLLARHVRLVGVSGSPIYNGFPEYWTSSSVLDGWTTSGLTLARSTSTANMYVSSEAALLSAVTGTLTLDDNWARYLQGFVPGSVTIRAWLRSDTASALRFQVLDDANSATSSAFHSGDGEWELVSLESHDLTDTDTQWTVRLNYANTGSTDEFGGIWVEGGWTSATHPFPLRLMPYGPDEILMGPLAVDTTNLRAPASPSSLRPVRGWDFQQYHAEGRDWSEGMIIWDRNRPPAGRLLYFIGRGPFTLPTADTGEIEVNIEEEQLVAKVAALILLENNPVSGDAKWEDRVSRLRSDIAFLSKESEGVSLGPTW